MNANTRPTDAAWLATHLAARSGEWVDMNAIIRSSIFERGCGLTVHSRVSELRTRRGLTIENRTRRTATGRVSSEYRLVPGVAVGEQARIAGVAS